ncbi:MAG: hypothetical protein ACRD50_14095, partial [Candidatus Acidiferrales bacterium]
RQRNVRAALEYIIEQVEDIAPTCTDVVIRAVRAYTRINDRGQWVEPPRRLIVTHLNSTADLDENSSLDSAAPTTLCHPERSEGSAFDSESQPAESSADAAEVAGCPILRAAKGGDFDSLSNSITPSATISEVAATPPPPPSAPPQRAPRRTKSPAAPYDPLAGIKRILASDPSNRDTHRNKNRANSMKTKETVNS